jgi:uncharacterized protein YodC (DUF2158 family)
VEVQKLVDQRQNNSARRNSLTLTLILAILLGSVTEVEKNVPPDQVLESGRVSGQSGLRLKVGGKQRVAFDPMYGPAVRCKWFRRAGGERSCINVSGL